MQIESLERRQLFAGDFGIVADLQVDANRDGKIDALDSIDEEVWTPGRGAIILPNLDRDNTATGAPDNWSGGNYNGKPIAPNLIIDNAADLKDIGLIRLNKLNTDAPYNYTLVLRVVRPSSDPTWFKNTNAYDRIRLFLPGTADGKGNTVLAAGDAAAIGGGIANTIIFKDAPNALNEYAIQDLAGSGGFFIGIEGITPGAVVQVQATLWYTPAVTDGAPPPPELINRDVVELKVAPFTLQDNRAAVKKVIVENLNDHPVGFDNAAVRAKLKELFGSKVIESTNGDFWQQDGYEIGYVQAPYGSMNVVLELPRAQLQFGNPGVSMRTFVRGSLLGPGVGVALDVAYQPIVDNSSLGGDIERLFKPGSTPGDPGFLLMSNMPQYLRDFFDAEGVTKSIDLPLDWLSVNHVDEVIQQTQTGKVLVADPDLAWALLLWAAKVDPNVRMHPGMNGNEFVPGYTPDGLKVTQLLGDTRLRFQNLVFLRQPGKLPTVRDKVRDALGLTEELTWPVKAATNKGDAKLTRGGAFTQLLGNVERTFEVRFLDADAYQLRFRDAGSTWSKWYGGKKSADTVFIEARAFLLKNYWTGAAQAGDTFTFKTVPNATLVRMPQLFATGGLLLDPTTPPPEPLILVPFTVNHINSLADRGLVVTGKAFGPKIAWKDSTKRDLLEDYVVATFKKSGYSRVELVDSTTYHNNGGSLHCGTNAIREIPLDEWWA